MTHIFFILILPIKRNPRKNGGRITIPMYIPVNRLKMLLNGIF